MFDIKENIASSPMVFLSRQVNTQDKEVKHVQGRTFQGYRSAYPLSSLMASHEDFSHGPLFSAEDDGRKKRWTPLYTVVQAILMAYDPSASLQDRFENARRSLIEIFSSRRRPGRTYQGFIKAVLGISLSFRRELQKHLCGHHQRVSGDSWRLFGWIPFAADGSRVEVPRTLANERALGRAGRDKTGPQLSLTTLYHVVSGLPWDWRIGAGTESERGHLRAMLSALPLAALLVMDAGFTGYDLLQEILAQGLSFVVRVGANITLLTKLMPEVERIERKGRFVWLWPSSKRDQKPLQLRLIRVKKKNRYSQGFQDVYLVTTVLEPERLSDEAIGILYRRRWGVEVFYRGFKRTLDQHKMRSDSPRQAREELHWAMTALLLLGLMGVEALSSRHIEPTRLSVASALRTVRRGMRTHQTWRYRGDIRILLGKAVKDSYHRRSSKTARDWPHKKNDPPPGTPKIREAKPNEIACAKKVYNAA